MWQAHGALVAPVVLLASLAQAMPIISAPRHVNRTLDECAQPFGNCLPSKCCVGEPTYGCHKKQGKSFAQCRRVDEEAGCTSDSNWQCPGEWEDCVTEKYENCWDSQCCFDNNFGCYRKAGLAFAQCRPMQANCVDSAVWLCPGWQKPTSPPIHHAQTHHTAPAPSSPRCSDPFESCTNNHCCNGQSIGFRCIEKKNRFFAQCIKPDRCVRENGNTCKDVTGQPILTQEFVPSAGTTPPTHTAGAGGDQQQAVGGSDGGGGLGFPLVVFLFALGLGGAFAWWYKKNYMLQPPTLPPVADSAGDLTPAAHGSRTNGSGESKRHGKMEAKNAIIDNNPDEDEDEEAFEEARKKKSGKKKKDRSVKKDDESRSALRNAADPFEMDL